MIYYAGNVETVSAVSHTHIGFDVIFVEYVETFFYKKTVF